MFLRSISTVALSCALAAPAFAGDVAALNDADVQTIVVTGQREEYGAVSTRSATRTETPLRNVPQAITVISESQIEDQALRSIADVLNYVPGATPGTGEGNRDQITLRGNNSTADFFVDGLRDDVQYFRDLYNAERVEILRGPNAMIFGRGGGGGVINRVTKRSSFAPYGEFAVSADSEGGYRLNGDMDFRLGAAAGLRINGVYEDGESFRRGVELERYAINPVAGFQVGPNTRIDLGYEYFHDHRTADRGLPSISGRPVEGADRTFFGDPQNSFADVDVHLGTFALEHRFGESLTLRNRTQYGDYDKGYQNIYPNSAVTNGELRLAAYRDTTRRKNLFSQTDLVWENQLGGVDQTLLLGFELGRQKSRNRRINGFFQVPGQPTRRASINVPVASPTVDADLIFLPFNTTATCTPPVVAACTPSNFNRSEANIVAVYAQDQIRLTDTIEIVAGFRFDRFELNATNLNNNLTFSRTDELVSPRLGLILKPMPSLSFYGSYSRSYLPSAGDQFTSLDLTAEGLKPERFDNYEIGAKWEPIPGLLATLAIYQLDRTNTRAPDPADPARIVLTGAQRSRGIEIGLERNISDRWQISAGYALQEAEITRKTSAAEPGKEVPLVPRHQFSLWNRYDLNRDFGVGLGIIAASKSYASLSNSVTLPGYARFDGAFFYKLSRGLEAQLNVENLFGTNYFPTAHNDNNIAPGAPRTFRGTLRFRF
jgi:catecholate siderophore receptor